MDHETELIRQQMDESRTALTDKLELLENQVVDSVQSATNAVADTVASVTDMVHDSVASVKDTFDLKLQVSRRPWTMLAGSAALGFLGGYLWQRYGVRRARDGGPGVSTAPAARPPIDVARNRVPLAQHSVTNGSAASASVSLTGEPGLLAHLGATFQAEISQLKGLAVGTLCGIVRDLIMDATPESTGGQVKAVCDGITVKIGGQPVPGRVLPERTEGERSGQIDSREDRGRRGTTRPHDHPSRRDEAA